MFAKKCPKCGGEVRTKIIKKSIGLGNVEIPVAQFCINPVCDWYQDFTDSRKPEDVKQNISSKYIIIAGVILAAAALFLLYNNFTHSSLTETPQITPQEIPSVWITTSPAPSSVPAIPAAETSIPLLKNQSRSVSVKIDVGHGFNPKVVNINRSDSVKWINEESQRTRVYFISKDNLFEKQLMVYTNQFSFQFNQSGDFTFALAEVPSMIEYPDAAGIVRVK